MKPTVIGWLPAALLQATSYSGHLFLSVFGAMAVDKWLQHEIGLDVILARIFIGLCV